MKPVVSSVSQVVLFSYVPNVERVCAVAMRSCNSAHSSHTLCSQQGLDGEPALNDERIASLLQKALEMGHHSVLEHAYFTFDLQNMSRACSHQLVRHRLASCSQQSQRHVRITRGCGYVKPRSVDGVTARVQMNGANVQLTFDDAMDLTRQIEESFLIQGVKAEDARYVRPNAATTNITVSMNARELLHFLALRCATPAQWEIRDMAWAMFACLKLVAPIIFRALPFTSTDSAAKEKAMKLESIVCGAYPIFTTAPLGTLIEIPLKELGLEHTVSAFVEKR